MKNEANPKQRSMAFNGDEERKGNGTGYYVMTQDRISEAEEDHVTNDSQTPRRRQGRDQSD